VVFFQSYRRQGNAKLTVGQVLVIDLSQQIPSIHAHIAFFTGIGPRTRQRNAPVFMIFSDLGLSEDVLRAIDDAGYSEPTPIQAEAIPYVLMGRDICGCAQTGTGKTASFTLPMIEILSAGRAKARMPRSLILEPTRELAAQVAESFDTYGKYHKLSKALLIGGENLADQAKVLKRGVDVVIATPGRLIDMFERGHLLLNDVKVFVIDESDRMLDMGFIPDVERIASMLPPLRTTLLFSATMPPVIRKLADRFLMNPKEITVARPSAAADTITQLLLMLGRPPNRAPGAEQKMKRESLRKLIRDEDPRNALIFCNRKRDVDVVHRSLNRHGLEAARLHGDMAQSVRMETLASFKDGKVKFMVCSDVAARGLDIPSMSHVFNFDVPSHAEDYVHRIGRTGRAGKEGRAITLATSEDRKYLRAIEHVLGQPIPLMETVGQTSTTVVTPDTSNPKPPEATDGKTVEATENKPKRRRRRGSKEREAQKQKPESENLKASPAQEVSPVQTEAPKPEKPKPSDSKVSNNRTPREKNTSPKDTAVKGMGDHMPAFMRRDTST
jgi:superfamily II DNA/RNA helicase